LKYIFNNPKMHIWHHAKDLPEPYGVNFGLSLSMWDYIFGTAYLPANGRDIKLGFKGVENYPGRFIKQLIEPFKHKRQDK
ncbi:MAG: sterol desaturase family protein, partial [Ferruginibacter sp.]